MRASRGAWAIAFAAAAAVLLAGALLAWLNLRGEAPVDRSVPEGPPPREQVERGAYLARAGNCIGCHTATGGAPLAGGRGVDTPFGVVVAPNITPDPETGIGGWSADEFWRALHNGRARDGRLLYPAFPYPSFTRVTREDSDALYAYLRSMPAVAQASAPHALRFPYGTQAALAVWRALYFRPGAWRPQPQQDDEWNRGRYLVDGLGHCAACHSKRNALGGIAADGELAGGLMPDSAWYAPSLASTAEAGVQDWPREQVVALLRDGVAAHASVSGPMADVVFDSTRHLSDPDLAAMARYLGSIPLRGAQPRPAAAAAGDSFARGGALYERHCASCHGERGQGAAGIYPALAGNRAVTMTVPNNLIQVIRQGGFAPTTAGNPRPFGMPPYGELLSDAEIAAVATFVRQSWGNAAAPVSTLDVLRAR